MAYALEAVGELASQSVVGRYLRQAGAEIIAERALKVAMVEAFPLQSMKPIPARSSLKSIADDPSLDEPVLPEASLPEAPASRSDPASAPLSDLSDVRETPSATSLDHLQPASTLDRKKLIPVAAAAATLGVVLTLVASLGADGPALELHSAIAPPPALAGASEIATAATATARAAPEDEPPKPEDEPPPEPESSAQPTQSGKPVPANTTPRPTPTHKTPKPTGKRPPPPPPSGSLYGRE
jgi:hypothetical protein